MPIMAIINLYLHMAIARDLDALQNTANLDVPSILSLYTPPLMKADPLLLSEADPLSARVDVGEAGR
jgi:hypothetical protein